MSNAIITITTNCINDLNLATELAQQQVVVTDIEQIHFQLANNTTVVFKKDAALQHYLNTLLGMNLKRVFRNNEHLLNHLTEKSVNIDGTLLLLKDDGDWLRMQCDRGTLAKL
ncbi:hypothetical protein GLP30_11270 [Photobacterium phosphoreum]|uniref:Uncharacterized protein n=1 Tax=Photobacterium phosphoreum TaxID=659 RepID=A0AAW4ZWX6_PHOPO|nr:hypothetical protein [Photobacterium phosphoreum]MCD9491498.1 hypothetical protein [Photobacterium phosphoreum]MCF2190666.1 hypothetical protein [Photobacterium phosphoreum]MCF2302407.1 hypothetical protein [Photobacterium phosphoreum]OBU37781.1 hypothetical protein AYY24_00580 [Photobacterium phosphoreum]PSU61383.1 hypothetical protein CTM75_12850 [Photobacterium phosphoreum]